MCCVTNEYRPHTGAAADRVGKAKRAHADTELPDQENKKMKAAQ